MFILIIACVEALQMGQVTFDLLFPHDKRLAFVQFETKFEGVPQIGISLIGLHVNNEVPRLLGIQPQILQVNNQGFQLQVINFKSKIDHLEYQWIAVQDDRIKVSCQNADHINFGREFWTPPVVQIFLAGFVKESQEGDLKFQLSASKIQTQSFEVVLNNQSKHTLKDILICYIAGPQHLVKGKQLININQKSDEFVDLEGTPKNLIYGVTKISNFYGALMIQLGEFKYESEKPGVGISQIDLSLAMIQDDGMLCPIGYTECNYLGTSFDLCESSYGTDSWKRIKSIRGRKQWSGQFQVGHQTLITNGDTKCIQDIQSYLH